MSKQSNYYGQTLEQCLWHDGLQQPRRPPLGDNLHADIAIVGAGYSGLWTAWYLKQAQPSLSISIVDGAYPGYGASGRNGGWLMGSIAGQNAYLAMLNNEDRALARDYLRSMPDHVEQQLRQAQIDCDFHKGGTLQIAARYPEQANWLQEELQQHRSLGFSNDDYHWLTAEELTQHCLIPNSFGALFTPHCATIHPAKLAIGLAKKVEELGVKIFERSPVVNIAENTIYCPTGTVSADIIVAATEGYSRTLGAKHILPVQSLIVATEPLSDSMWQSIGFHNRPSFCEASKLVTYAHRSSDNRLVFGARGNYRFGSNGHDDFLPGSPPFQQRCQLLEQLLPQLAGVRYSHQWGGTLGMARNLMPFAAYDRPSGRATLGGYGGEGVAASNLMARTLADLILQRDTALAQMPWARNSTQLRPWEPEPLRWLGYSAIRAAYTWEEQCNLRPARGIQQKLATAISGIAGRLLNS